LARSTGAGLGLWLKVERSLPLNGSPRWVIELWSGVKVLLLLQWQPMQPCPIAVVACRRLGSCQRGDLRV